MPRMEIHYAGDSAGAWAALYVDGRLNTVGDAYRTEEIAFELAGVKQVQDDAFMRGQIQRDGVAQTLDEVQAYRDEREARIARAKAKRDEAARLLAEAEDLERAK